MVTKKTAKAAVEMVDIVDKDDKVLGQMTEDEAMAGKGRYRIVHVILVNDEGGMLVQWRSATKKISPRMFTASAAGKVMAGESYEAAALREMKEEVGAEGVKLKLLGDFQTPISNGMAFVGEWNGEPEGWEEEADAVDYWSAEEADYMFKRFPYLLSTGFQKSLKLLLKKTKQGVN